MGRLSALWDNLTIQGLILPHGSSLNGSQLHPQFLHHRAHRSRQIDARRPPARSDRRALAARNDGAGARLHGPGARARHHHQSPRRAAELSSADDGNDVPAEPDRHARATSTSPTKFRAACRPAKARCWWWTPRRAWKRRRSPTRTWRCSHNLEIIPVINKIDLPSAEPERIREQIEQVIGLRRSDAILASAKNGHRHQRDPGSRRARWCRRPQAIPDAPLRALIFDSWFDPYRGVIILVRVVDGRMRMGQKIRLWSNGTTARSRGPGLSVAQADPLRRTVGGRSRLPVRQHQDRFRRADRRHHHRRRRIPRPSRCPGFEEIKPMVFAGLYPVESHEHGRAARCARKAAPERQRLQLRAGKFGGAGLWIPLRLSRAAASGDRAGAAGARVQYRPDHDRAGRALPRHQRPTAT